MIGGRFRPADGFTIVETMIVLAVSTFLFIAVAGLINGKQRNAEFNQAVRNLQVALQENISSVSAGFYPNDGRLKCSASGAGPQLSNGGSDAQGSSSACLFMGKAIKFNVGNADPQVYDTYTIAGLRRDASSSQINLSTAQARLVAKASGGDTTPDDQYDSDTLLYGSKIDAITADGVPVAAIGFAGNLSALGNGDTAQPLTIFGIPGTGSVTADRTRQQGVSAINTALLIPTTGTAAQKIEICLASGGTDQSAKLIINGDNRANDISLKFFNGVHC